MTRSAAISIAILALVALALILSAWSFSDAQCAAFGLEPRVSPQRGPHAPAVPLVPVRSLEPRLFNCLAIVVGIFAPLARISAITA